MLACVEQYRVTEVVADHCTKPLQVHQVGFLHGGGELHLHGHQTAVAASNDEVDFVFSPVGAQVAHLRLT